MGRTLRLIAAGTALALPSAFAARAAADGDVPPAPVLGPAPTADPAAKPAPPPGDLRAAVEKIVGAPLHGTLTNRYRLREADDGTDQDVHTFLDLRAGDESKDRVSAQLFTRLHTDLDRAHEDDPSFTYSSIDDTFDHSVNALLYTATVTVRPAGGPLESMKFGRQYVYAAETFHVDGASATTRPLVDSVQLTITGFGGVPVHFYESSPSGDWIAGLRVAADPWKGGRAAVDYVHDEDRYSLLSREDVNDFAAMSMWQNLNKNIDLYGQFGWIDGPRDTTFRATATLPEHDFFVQTSYYRLFETETRLATEFDQYTNELQDYSAYHQADLRATKGLGEHFEVSGGASARRLLAGEDETPFNRNVRRVYLTPSVLDLPWKGTSASVTGETYSGDGEKTKTWGVDVSHEFKSRLRLSGGSDYTLYGYGPVATDERTHVRTAYVRARYPLTKSLSSDVRYTWEKDDEETFHVLSLALVLEF